MCNIDSFDASTLLGFPIIHRYIMIKGVSAEQVSIHEVSPHKDSSMAVVAWAAFARAHGHSVPAASQPRWWACYKHCRGVLDCEPTIDP